MTILEAPDNETVARISSESGFPGNDRADEYARVFRGRTHERTKEIKIAHVYRLRERLSETLVVLERGL